MSIRAQIEQTLARTPGQAVFEQCDLSNADLARLDFTGASFNGCSLAGASFFAATLDQTQWRGCRGAAIDFGATRVIDVRVNSCDFNNSSWRRAKLSSVRFEGSKLTGAQFVECSQLAVEFVECLLVAAHLRGFSFRKQRLSKLDLSDADLAGSDFRDAVFEGGSLRSANLADVRFQGADLREADLGGIRLQDARLLRGATISKHQAATLLSELGVLVL